MSGKIGHSKKPTALFIWVDSIMGGAERRFLRLIGYLHANDYDVHLFTSEGGVRALESLGVAIKAERLHVLSGGQ